MSSEFDPAAWAAFLLKYKAEVIRTIEGTTIVRVKQEDADPTGCSCGSPRCTYPGSFHCRRG